MDNTTPEIRSRMMKANRSCNTKPELVIRSMIHRMGFRYRVNLKVIPGKPDIAFTKMKKAIFIHGCFWHQHDVGCSCAHLPQSNKDYWSKKFTYNRQRDIAVQKELTDLGWRYLIIWECELNDIDIVRNKVLYFLNNNEYTSKLVNE
jgi:DNA mismatch endonuclease (patch repair protein)